MMLIYPVDNGSFYRNILKSKPLQNELQGSSGSTGNRTQI